MSSKREKFSSVLLLIFYMVWFIVLSVIILLIIIIPIYISAPVYKGAVSDHFNGKEFLNYGGIKQTDLVGVVKWMWQRKKPYKGTIPVRQTIPKARIEKGLVFTFINHTTILIQVDGLNIITDPVFSERVSPFKWIGPKRQAIPGVKFEDLPQVDIVLLSHNHYDHLDIDYLKLLAKKFNPKVYTTLGVGKLLAKNGIGMIKEMDWWDDLDICDGLKLNCVPAQHFSGRGSMDRNKTLWAGFILETQQGSIYFAADTGFGPFLEKIKARFPKIDFALIPIGAYQPRWFMSPIHISPDQSVEIHMMLGIRKSIATHFGTFALADEGFDEPVKDLRAALLEKGIPLKDFIILHNGEAIDFKKTI